MSDVIGVCGAGAMGSGIAQVCARGNFEVRLYDVDRETVTRAVEQIGQRLRRDVEKGRLDDADARSMLARITPTEDLDALSDAMLVIEAVIESMPVKQDVMARLEARCPPETILASNTSTLSVTEIGSVLEDPGRCIGLHFFNPAHRMRLVEVVPGYDTRDDVVQRLIELSTSLGLTPVRVNESPGGIVSRLQLLVRNEAARMVAEGVATPEDIDKAMKLGSGWPLGPFELIDLVGLDVHVVNSDSLSDELGSERYRPHALLRKMYRAGHHGRKSGRGFYTYEDGGNA
jgi:3-hydroxybutyryl-CoA dehydrogenase